MTAAGNASPPARIGGLTKCYGDTRALDGVGLELAAGELRGLLGPNGAGKTTLLRILFGLVAPDAGTVELLGGPLPAGRRFPARGVAGFVEEPAFYGYLSGRANLELLAALDHRAGADIDEALERVGLAGRGDDRVGAYSTGMRQRLGIAAALLRAPRLLLLDEPTSGLDPAGILAVGALLRDLSAQGVAVILSSHLIGELEALCHSFTIIRAGRVARLAEDHAGLSAGLAEHGAGTALRVTVTGDGLDGFVRALVRDGLAVRRLELVVSPLESLFFSLTDETGSGDADAWIAARARARSELRGGL